VSNVNKQVVDKTKLKIRKNCNKLFHSKFFLFSNYSYQLVRQSHHKHKVKHFGSFEHSPNSLVFPTRFLFISHFIFNHRSVVILSLLLTFSIFFTGLEKILQPGFHHRELVLDMIGCAHIAGNHIEGLSTAGSENIKTFFSSFMASNSSYNNLSERIRFLIFYAASFGIKQPNKKNHPSHYICVEQSFPFALSVRGSCLLRVVLCPLDKDNKEVLNPLPRHKKFGIVSAYPV